MTDPTRVEQDVGTEEAEARAQPELCAVPDRRTGVGVLLIIVAVLYAVDVARGGAGEAEEGEDIDLETSVDWRTIGLLIGAFAVNAVLIEPLGWVISGALLFWGSAFALGNRHHVRGLAAGVALSLITFYAFAIGLGVNLPAGILQGIL